MIIDIATVENDVRLATIGQEIQPIQAAVNALEIRSPEAENGAVEMLAQIRAKVKEITALEKSFVDGPKAFVKMVGSFFRPKVDALEDLERKIKQKMIVYRDEIARQEAEARRKAEEKQRKAEVKAEAAGKPAPIAAPLPILSNPSTVRSASGAVSFRVVKKWRIVDAGQIPDRYWILDETQIGKESRAGAVIPGVEIYEEKEPSIRV